MQKLLAVVTALVTVGATGCFGVGIAAADDTPAGWTPDHGHRDGPPPLGTPGRGYALGGAHVLGIPYDEYIKRTGAEWFPGLKRQIVDYPAGQVQGHVLERLFPGIGRLGDELSGPGYRRPQHRRVGRRGRGQPRNGDPQRWSRHRDRLVRGSAGARRRAGEACKRSDRAAAEIN